MIFLLKRKNTHTEQNEKQQTLNVFSQDFGLNASGLENKRDIIRFLLTFICENTFLPPPPLLAQSYSRLFSLTSEEESLRCSVESALSDSHLIVNNQEPAKGSVVHNFAHNIKIFKTYLSNWKCLLKILILFICSVNERRSVWFFLCSNCRCCTKCCFWRQIYGATFIQF